MSSSSSDGGVGPGAGAGRGIGGSPGGDSDLNSVPEELFGDDDDEVSHRCH